MQSTDSKIKKMLLMGRKEAGKTSMHSIIFANYPPRETMGIGYTVEINESKFRFMGNLTLNLWDCGGQDSLMKQYFTTQKETIFKNVEVLIYVFDVEKEVKYFEYLQGVPYDEELRDYKSTITNLSAYSRNAIVFVLIHKIDKIKDSEKSFVFDRKKNDILNASDNMVYVKEIFATSIWDETLYKAWSQIVQNLIPNIQIIKDSLINFCETCNCEEVVLFEKSTFLIIAYHEVKETKDIMKYERLSNIIKQFKLSCTKIAAQIQAIQVRSSNFTTYIDEFTDNTFIMLVYSDPLIQPASIAYNINYAKRIFEKSNVSDIEKLVLLKKRGM